MSKHTPGPWLIFRDPRPDMEWNNHIGTLIDGKEFDVCFMTHDGTKENLRGEANARLIAAAPRLLEACQKASEMFSEEPADAADFKDAARKIVISWNAACAAIAEAEGEET